MYLMSENNNENEFWFLLMCRSSKYVIGIVMVSSLL
jgi:hypothetical protein